MERLTRREFLKGLGLAAFSIACGNLLHSIEHNNNLDWLESPNGWKFFSTNTLPTKLTGAHVATPFLYTSTSEIIDRLLDEVGFGIKSATIFIDDRFEKTLGNYEDGVLSKAKEFAETLYRRDMDIILVLFDFYTMRKTWNPFYGSHDATSPYAIYGEEKFYSSKRLNDNFIERIKRITKRAKNFPNLAAVAIANEPYPPEGNPFDENFIRWFKRMIEVIKEELPDTPILPGVANPFFITDEIKGLGANTAHVYFHDPLSFINTIKYSKNGKLPLFVHEFGAVEEIFGYRVPFNVDNLLSQVARELLARGSSTNFEEREVELRITSLTFWKKDNYVDGFNFDQLNNPKTYQVVEFLDYISKNLEPRSRY